MFRRKSLDPHQHENLPPIFPSSELSPPPPPRRAARYSLAPSENLAHLADFRKLRKPLQEKALEPPSSSSKVIPSDNSTRRIAQLDIKVADVQRQLDEAILKIEELKRANQALEESNDRLNKENKELRAKNVRRREGESNSSTATKPKRPKSSSASRAESVDEHQEQPEQNVEIKIEGINRGTTSSSLLQQMEEHGRVASVRITKSSSGEVNGYVTFKSRTSALRAMDALKSTGHFACFAASKKPAAATGEAEKKKPWKS